MQAQSANTDLAIHTLGWKAFQDLCAQVCAEVLGTTVSIYREAQDGGQDAVFLTRKTSQEREVVEATVQCKFSGKANQRLRVGDVEAELSTVRELVASGRAQTYHFITSLGVDATVAAKIRDKLVEAGVSEPHVYGREWLTLQIRSSARLRALVPRIYGLGDLSTILDERCVSQTHALLGHLQSSLCAYVPTTAHRTAVRILGEHKIVLLLGAPATGKSMIAAILATTAIDGDKHQCLKCDGPLELSSRWNPHESNRLYWIDDAFGPNQLRTDYIDCWINTMPKVKTAIESGNRFILTSRSHIWHGAKPKLGTRNMSVLEDGRAVVDLGSLSPEEREQIIYNHLKAGNQPTTWKRRIKLHLPSLAENPRLLPEIARRLGDSRFTKALINLPGDLIKYVAEPAEFLIQTIQELDEPHQAAMTLIFLHQGKLAAQDIPGDSTNLVAEKYGVTARAISEALPQLEGSFVSIRREDSMQFWGFVHPTFTDAISSMLSARPDLVDLYVRGARVETLLAEATCEGAVSIRDAVVIPSSASDHLVSRLIKVPDVAEINRALFEFLANRASDSVIVDVLSADSGILKRVADSHWRTVHDPRVCFLARAHKLHRLPNDLRFEVAYELEHTALNDLDASFLGDDDILALLQPTQLLQLGGKLVAVLDDNISDRICKIADEADPDSDVPDQFDQVRSFVEQLKETYFFEETILNRLQSVSEEIDEAIAEVSSKRSPEEDTGFWSNISPAKVTAAPKGRSIFSDIDDEQE